MPNLELGVREGSKEVALQEPGSRSRAGRLETGDQVREERNFTLHRENKCPHAGHRRALFEKSGVKQETHRIRVPVWKRPKQHSGLPSTWHALAEKWYYRICGFVKLSWLQCAQQALVGGQEAEAQGEGDAGSDDGDGKDTGRRAPCRLSTWAKGNAHKMDAQL